MGISQQASKGNVWKMKWKFWLKSSKITDEKKVKLIVTGTCKEDCLRKIEKDCREQGVKVVATNTPVLGVFEL